MVNITLHKKHSIELVIIELINRIITALNNKFLPIPVSMDLS